jgi:hypothetical protein
MSLRLNRWFRRAAIGFTAVALLLLGLRAALHVADGAAADSFTNVKGVHISWGTALVFVVSLAVALGAALVARWWQGRGGFLRFASFVRVRVARPDAGASGSPTDMPPNKSFERTREG